MQALPPELATVRSYASLFHTRSLVTRPTRTTAILLVVVLLAAAAWAIFFWRSSAADPRPQLLRLMPSAADAVLYADLSALRQTQFLQELYRWAPHPAQDTDYQQFLRDTGFNYETDLDRIAIALEDETGARRFLAVADGRFNEKKIESYALRTGKKEEHAGRTIYIVPSSGENLELALAFLSNARIVITDLPNLAETLEAPEDPSHKEWETRFERLAGSPVFALLRRDAAAEQALAAQAPGFRSPQLATLLDRLQWISIAARPIGEHLQVVAEGETTDEQTTRQLSDFLNGALVLAEAGLDGAQVRAQLDNGTRQTYLDLLKSADISRLDRGETKSVRIVLDVSPAVLKLAPSVPRQDAQSPAAATGRRLSASPSKTAHGKH